MKTLGILLLTFVLSIPVYAGEKQVPNNYVVRDNNYQIQNYVKDGRIYDKDYRPQGYVTKDGRIRDNNYNTTGYWNSGGSRHGGHHSHSGRHR